MSALTLISQVFGLVFSKTGRETITALVGDKAARDKQAADAHTAGLNQLSAEFARDRRGILDDVADALNRLPRPLFALGTFALFIYAFKDPIGFAARMQALAVIPEPLWMTLGAIITFYFVGRMQAYHVGKGASPETVRQTAETIRQIEAMRPVSDEKDLSSGPNPALENWNEGARG